MTEEFNKPKLRIRNTPVRVPSSGSQKTPLQLPRLFDNTAQQVDKEISQLEVTSRLRDLEIMMLDFKANIERRVQKHIEENPQKYISSVKQLEQQEMQIWKQLNDKQLIMQDQIAQIRVQGEKNRDQLTQQLLEQQKKTYEIDIKLSKISNTAEAFEVLKANYQPQPAPVQPNNNDLETKLLREQFQNDKLHKDALTEDLQRQWQDMHQRLMRQEAEFYQRLKTQREEFIDQLEKTKHAIKGLDNMKIAKINTDQEYLKNMIGSVEARIADEVEKRLRAEFEGRNALENKLQVFKEEIRNDERQILMGEQKFMKQMHDSVSSLNQIIKNTKEQLEANLAASQTIVTENLRSLSKTTELIRESTFTKVALIEQGQKELNLRLGETKQMFQEHANLINATLQKEFTRQNDQLLEQSQQLQKAIDEQMRTINDERAINDGWKKQFTNKNLAIFAEVSQTFKNVKAEQQKDKQDLSDGIHQARNELKQNVERLHGLIMNQEQVASQMQQQMDFRFGQSKRETEELVHNQKIYFTTEILGARNEAIKEANENSKLMVLDAKAVLNERITKEMELAEQETENKLKTQLLVLKEHIAQREKIMTQKIENLIQQEKEQRDKLQQLIAQYSEMMNKLQDRLDSELRKVRGEFDDKLNIAVAGLRNDLSEQIAIVKRQQQQESINLENRLNQKLDSLSASIAKQQEQLKEYIQSIEKNTKSFVEQRLEQHNFELKAMIKEIENDVFKMRVWLLQQVEQMNSAMREIHVHIQTELYMERMYQSTLMDQYQEHMDSILQRQHEYRKLWQKEMEIKQAVMEESLNEKIEATRLEAKNKIEHLEGQMNVKIEELRTTFSQNLEEVYKELQQTMTEQQEQLRQDMKDLDDRLNQNVNTLSNQVEQEFQLVNQNMDELRKDTQEGFTASQTQNILVFHQLKKQIDESYSYFEAKFFMETMMRQANEQLDRERHTGIIGKLNLLVQEMERLEEKKNKLKKDLAGFINDAQINFDTMQKAIISHGQFLNELDSRMTIENMYQQTINEFMNAQLQAQLVNSTGQMSKLKEQIEEVDNQLQDVIQRFPNQLEEIQNQMEEQGEKISGLETQLLDLNKMATETVDTQKEHQQYIEQLEQKILKNSKDLEEQQAQLEENKNQIEENQAQIRNQLKQQLEAEASIELIKTRSGAMEVNLERYINNKTNQCLELLSKNYKLMLQNMQTMEKNFQTTMSDQIGTMTEQVQDLAKRSSDEQAQFAELKDTNRKLIEDYNQLARDTNLNFEKMNGDINQLQSIVGSNPKEGEMKDDVTAQGLALDQLKQETAKELKKLEQMINSLGQAQAQNLDKTGKGDNTTLRGEIVQVSNRVVELEEKVKQLQTQQPGVPKKSAQVSPNISSNNEVQAINTKIDEIEKGIDAKFDDIDRQIQELQQSKNQLNPSLPSSQKISPNEVQQVKNELQTLKQDVAKLQKGQSAPQSKQGTSNDIERVQQDIDDIGKELDVMKGEIENLKKATKQQPAQPVAQKGAAANQDQTGKEVQQLKNDLKDLENDIQDQFQQIQAELDGLKAQASTGAQGKSNNNASQGEIKAIQDEIAKLKQQMQGGQGQVKQAPQAMNSNQELNEKKFDQIEKDLDEIGKNFEDIWAEIEELKSKKK